MSKALSTYDVRRLNVDDVPRLVADKLARRCWSVSREDLRQEAEAAALHARKNYDPEKGDLRGYLWRACARHLTNYMWEMGSPVTYKHRRNELRATSKAQVNSLANVTLEDVDPDRLECTEEAIALNNWRMMVAQRIEELAGNSAEWVVELIVNDETPKSIAQKFRLPLMDVLEAHAKMRDAVSTDPVMGALWDARSPDAMLELLRQKQEANKPKRDDHETEEDRP